MSSLFLRSFPIKKFNCILALKQLSLHIGIVLKSYSRQHSLRRLYCISKGQVKIKEGLLVDPFTECATARIISLPRTTSRIESMCDALSWHAPLLLTGQPYRSTDSPCVAPSRYRQ